MPESSNGSLPRSWKEFREALADYAEIIAFIVWLGTGFSWFTGVIPTTLVLILAGIALAFTGIAVVGHVLISGAQPLTTLGGNLLPEQRVPTRRKLRPRTNLVLLRIEHQVLYQDEHEGFIELNLTGERQPCYCACLRFANEPVLGQPGQRIRSLRARLIYQGVNGREYAPIDRGMWVREEFNAFDLEVGDSRLLVVAWGFPPNVLPNTTLPTSWLAFAPGNNHYSAENYRAPLLMALEDNNLAVRVQLLAGDGGHVLYDSVFDLQTEPELVLTQNPN